MKQRLLSALAAIALISGPATFATSQDANAQDAKPKGDAKQTISLPATEVYDRAITHFYMQSNLAQAFQSIDALVKQKKTSRTINFEALTVFFAEVIRRDSRVLSPLAKHFSKYRNDLNMLPWMAAWQSGTEVGKETVERLKEAGHLQAYNMVTRTPAVDFRKDKPRGHSTIDGLWVNFYATGNLQDVALILQVALEDEKDEAGVPLISDEVKRAALKKHAFGSMVVHAAKHPSVMQLLAKTQPALPENKQKIVKEMIGGGLFLARKYQESAQSQLDSMKVDGKATAAKQSRSLIPEGLARRATP